MRRASRFRSCVDEATMPSRPRASCMAAGKRGDDFARAARAADELRGSCHRRRESAHVGRAEMREPMPRAGALYARILTGSRDWRHRRQRPMMGMTRPLGATTIDWPKSPRRHALAARCQSKIAFTTAAIRVRGCRYLLSTYLCAADCGRYNAMCTLAKPEEQLVGTLVIRLFVAAASSAASSPMPITPTPFSRY